MNDLKTWLKDIKTQEIKARNKSRRGLSLCFNFLQVPNTETVVLTLSVMYNGERKNAMEPTNFARVLSKIEGILSNLRYSGDNEDLYFVPVTNKLSKDWYSTLGCHRLFFVPDDCVWELIGTLFSKNNLEYFRSLGVSGVPVYVDTNEYNTTIKFF